MCGAERKATDPLLIHMYMVIIIRPRRLHVTICAHLFGIMLKVWLFLNFQDCFIIVCIYSQKTLIRDRKRQFYT